MTAERGSPHPPGYPRRRGAAGRESSLARSRVAGSPSRPLTRAPGMTGRGALPVAGFVVGRQAALGGEAVDHVRDHPGDFVQELVPRHPGLPGEVLDGVGAERVLELVRGELPVLPMADPGIHVVAIAALTELVEEAAEAARSAAAEKAAEPAAGSAQEPAETAAATSEEI